MKKSTTTAAAIQTEMKRLIDSGMTIEQAARAIAEQNTRRYTEGLRTAKARKRSYR